MLDIYLKIQTLDRAMNINRCTQLPFPKSNLMPTLLKIEQNKKPVATEMDQWL